MLFDLCRQWFGEVHGWLFQSVVLPIVQWSGLSVYTEDAFDGTEEFLFGALQVLLLAAVLMPLERRFPRERWQGVAAVRTDVIYTFLHRLGLFPLFFFFAFRPMFDRWESWLHFNGWPTTNLETWWPALAANPLLAFAAYLVIIDFAKYWIHRAQHRFEWWWALHSLHHSQRQMTFWTDDRNHLLDSVLTDGTLALLALGIGVAPGQFLALVVVTRMVESLSHANLRINFGAVGERLLVSPRFHRLHHAISASRGERLPRGELRDLAPGLGPGVSHGEFHAPSQGLPEWRTNLRDETMAAAFGRSNGSGSSAWRASMAAVR